jgi:hypothetical protein
MICIVGTYNTYNLREEKFESRAKAASYIREVKGLYFKQYPTDLSAIQHWLREPDNYYWEEDPPNFSHRTPAEIQWIKDNGSC